MKAKNLCFEDFLCTLDFLCELLHAITAPKRRTAHDGIINVSFIEFVEMVCVMLLGAIKTCIHFEKSPRSLIAVRVIFGYRDIH